VQFLYIHKKLVILNKIALRKLNYNDLVRFVEQINAINGTMGCFCLHFICHWLSNCHNSSKILNRKQEKTL